MPAIPILVDIGLALSIVVLIGLRFGYTYTLGKVLIMSAALLNTVVIPTPFGQIRLLGFAADALLKADHAIMHTLGRGISDMQAVFNESVSYTAQAIHWIGHEIAALAHDTASAVEGLHVQNVTNVYKKVNPGLAAKVGALAALVATLRHAVVPRVERITHVVTHEVKVIQRAVAVPDIGAIPRVVPRVGHIEAEAEAALARARDFAKRFGPAALIGTVAFALAKMGITWARCSRVNKVGKRICGVNDGLLDGLLADLLLVTSAISIVEFAKELQSIEVEVVSGLERFVREI